MTLVLKRYNWPRCTTTESIKTTEKNRKMIKKEKKRNEDKEMASWSTRPFPITNQNTGHGNTVHCSVLP